MNIVESVVVAKVNPYTKDVRELIAAGGGVEGQFEVPVNDVNKVSTLIRSAINAEGHGARLVGISAPDKDGISTISFRIAERRRILTDEERQTKELEIQAKRDARKAAKSAKVASTAVVE